MKVVYFTYRGLFADNPRAVYEGLLARDDLDLDAHWLCTPKTQPTFPPGVETVLYGTPEAARRPRGGRRRRRQRLHVHGVDEAARRLLPADLARHPAQADPPRRPRPAGVAGQARQGRRPLGPAALPEPGEHRAAARTRSASRARPRDRLPAQRRPDARTGTTSARGCARSWASPTGRTAVLYAPTWRDDLVFDHAGDQDFEVPIDLAAFAERLGEDHVLLTAAAQHGGRPARDPAGRAGGRRVRPRRIRGALPGGRYAGHRLLVGHVRLCRHGQAHGLLHLRPRALPRRRAWLLLRPRRGSPRAAGPSPARNSSRRSPTAMSPPRTWQTGTRSSGDTFCSLEDGHATDRVLDLLFPPGDPAERSTMERG